MRKIVKFVTAIVAMMAVGCYEPDNSGLVYLDVTPNNIKGVWRMESFDDGGKLADGSYFYIVFDRAERTFVTYDNIGSMGAYRNSGRYDIVTDGAAIIRGVYDFGRGDWEHSYFVSNLTNDSMVWTAVDDDSIKRVYVRDMLPEWIDADK